VVEQLGADTLVHGRFGSDRTGLTVRLSGIANFKSGEVLPLQVSPDHLHLFDSRSGKRIAAG
jgi:sn-glycerol 3-phosphate transport system ATP-binding protein